MSSETAALLTKTQRQRIRNRFAELDSGKRRRDQQRIRERIAAGTKDFGLLVDYPDDQLRTAFDDYGDDELLDVLADGRVVLERVRESRGLDRERVVERARERTRAATDDDADTETLGRLHFETASEVRRRVEADVRERQRPSPWRRRSDRLLRTAVWFLLPVLLLWVADQVAKTTFLADYKPVWAVLFAVSVVATTGAVAIKSAQFLKHSVVSPLRTLVTDPETALSTLYDRIVATPGRRLRRAWDDL
ncbi:hypothetical protein [Halorussus aquaticus]|uniref:Uncharacterized protein n=1 Tax=Halorussus aquaticus TaxID=2953748 RepID=A0ABD5Q6P7_9EURY|nr:hypothetical protein [Halorussus aquaticus]